MPRKVSKTNQVSKNRVSLNNYLEKLETQIESNQSKFSLVLGALIVLVIGILVFNYFNRNKATLGPAQQTTQQAQQDVSPDNLPGKYTVKEGDTLFTIAENYYKSGDKFSEIAKANNLTDPNQLQTGQVLEIPKLVAQASAQPSTTPQPSASPEASTSPETTEQALGTGGGNSTIWGSRIEGDTYTVVEGDWLSTIAGRAYGDIFTYKKLAEVNNIPNPDHIEPGMVLKIPR